MIAQTLIACPACDLLHQWCALPCGLPAGNEARCTRCGTILYRQKKLVSLDFQLALALAGLVMLALANFYPFLTLNMEGRVQDTVMISGVLTLYAQGHVGLAGLVLLTGIVCPLAQLVGLAYVLVPLKLGWVPPKMALVYRWVRHIQPWAMTEIFMLGTLVTVVKLASTATVVPGPALFAFMALVLILPAATIGLNPESVWERLDIKQAP